MKKRIVLFILIAGILNACSVEYKLTRNCDIRVQVLDTLQGQVVFCGACDSLKTSFINKIQKKYNNKK